MKVFRFLKSPAGSLCAFVVLAAVGGVMIHRSNTREKARASQMTMVEAGDVPAQRESIVRPGHVLKIPTTSQKRAATPPPVPADESPERPAQSLRSSNRSAEQRPRVLPISLFSGNPPTGPELSKTYAPYGRLIPCETVVTLESSRLDTPVIGLVTEDVWHDGRLIIPAGVEIHGRASLDRSRERIAATGKWVVVWRDGTPLNGTELVLSGIALDRDKDEVSGHYGIRDGSAGLVGQLLKTDDWQEIKLFASTFLAGMANGLQELRSQGTAYGDVLEVPVTSGRNAALRGTADVLNAYARQIQETIARDGFFVRVPAGKQFYLYVTETVDVARGTRGNVANAEIWRKADAN